MKRSKWLRLHYSSRDGLRDVGLCAHAGFEGVGRLKRAGPRSTLQLGSKGVSSVRVVVDTIAAGFAGRRVEERVPRGVDDGDTGEDSKRRLVVGGEERGAAMSLRLAAVLAT